VTRSTHAQALLSRRRFLQLGAASGAALTGAATTAGQGRASVRAPAPRSPRAAQQGEAGHLRIASRIGSIDVGDDLTFPSLDRFSAETGISVDYQEVVEDDEAFYLSDLRDPFEAAVPTAWDLVVVGDPMAQHLIASGWLEPIDLTTMTRYPANLAERYRSRTWDPGNAAAAPWHSMMVAIGHDQERTGPLDDLEALFGGAYAGRVSWLPEMRDTLGLAALDLGIDPATIDQAGFDTALSALEAAIAAGVPRPVGEGAFVEDLLLRDAVVAAAPSADMATIVIPNQGRRQDLRWTLPADGGMFRSDNLVIPLRSEGRAAAEAFIDWYYDPANAAPIEAFVHAVSPVVGTAEAMAAIDPALAEDPLIFPSEDMLGRLHEFRSLSLEEAAAWQEAYRGVVRRA
jgi:spermidine/putrescine transport system substrate-binding protein